ncbi:Similar to GPR155: Integral membrane protein GPR155 (Homo sapiens) [Cotesia congregata]|uniref:Similar to GPR155: Integral membrane protein GPR155 (Homo sapiens) n=1 Tax=Cotesia congregata TaxID=51543 RepID=A0A8J2HTZ0_COTCN|nr:Similar to GPR155: Integral membrane protein GPR155 (Homo sapiens) [Cotesia congregata]
MELDIPDTPTDNLYLALIQCFAIILCGYIAGRLEIITKSEANGLNTFVGTFALPSLIFLSLAKLDFSLVNWKFLLAVFLAKACVFLVVLGVSLIVTRPTNPGRAALFAIFATQSNDFAIGYPMIDALYGDTHSEYAAYLYLMAPISLAILNPIGFILLEIGKRRTGSQQSGWKLVGSVVKGIGLNPILFMTVLGIIGNFIFSHQIPKILSVILEVFGNAFSASALFLLGLMMVGKIHTLKGPALVIPGILISVKLLALPMIIRESVILLNAGVNETDTRDLSTYGFLYGTIPTAPALFIFTLRYNIDIDLIASSMVACTFLSAPLMFVSAKLITAINDGVSPAKYAQQLNTFSMDVSVASIAACLWLFVCFVVLAGKRYKRPTHRCTLYLIIAQLAVGIGVIIWTKLEPNEIGSFLWYVQFVLITVGVYASRMWTVVLAGTLLFLSSRTLTFVQNMQKWIMPIGFMVPVLTVGLMCLIISPKNPDDIDLRNPNFQFGRVQAAISIFILLFCFIVTLGCLVLQQRYQRRHHAEVYASLINNNTDNAESTMVETRNIVDVEDLIPSGPALPAGNCVLDTGCGFQRNGGCIQDDLVDEQDFEIDQLRIDSDDPQLLRHLVLLIFLLCSMFIGLALSIGTMIMEQMTGVYAELAFLDVAFSYGQSLIVFVIFGLDPGLGKLGSWLKKVCKEWRTRQKLQLPDEESLSAETKTIREQFRQCHLHECRQRISNCRRRLLKVYQGVFSGSDLVDWLLEQRLVQNREEAVQYGRCLLESRVLHHVDGTHHFHDKNILYSFRG